MSTRIPAERARPNLAQAHRALQLCSYAGAFIILAILFAEPGHHALKTVSHTATTLFNTVIN